MRGIHTNNKMKQDIGSKLIIPHMVVKRINNPYDGKMVKIVADEKLSSLTDEQLISDLRNLIDMLNNAGKILDKLNREKIYDICQFLACLNAEGINDIRSFLIFSIKFIIVNSLSITFRHNKLQKYMMEKLNEMKLRCG